MRGSRLDPCRRDGLPLRAEHHDRPLFIDLGGGQNCESAGEAIEAGANAIVVRAAIFGSSDYAAPIAAVRQRPRPSARKARS